MLNKFCRNPANNSSGFHVFANHCASGNYGSGHVLYYSCPNGSASCVPAAVPGDLQMQNPVAAFLPDADGIVDNNGSVIMMPAVPDLGASIQFYETLFGAAPVVVKDDYAKWMLVDP